MKLQLLNESQDLARVFLDNVRDLRYQFRSPGKHFTVLTWDDLPRLGRYMKGSDTDGDPFASVSDEYVQDRTRIGTINASLVNNSSIFSIVLWQTSYGCHAIYGGVGVTWGMYANPSLYHSNDAMRKLADAIMSRVIGT